MGLREQTHLMFDIETLDTKPTAVVLSVAAVLFTPYNGMYSDALNVTLSVPEQLKLGRTVDQSTWDFWAKQDKEVRDAQFFSDTSSLETLRANVKELINKADYLWANDPDFDLVILRDLVGYDLRWPFWKHRSFRTMKMLKGPPAYTPLKAHDPLEDARAQAKSISAWLRTS